MLFGFYLTHGSESLSILIQAKKISFVETGKNAEYSIWGARKCSPTLTPIILQIKFDCDQPTGFTDVHV